MSNLKQKLAELVERNSSEIEYMEDNNMNINSKNNVVSIVSNEDKIVSVVPEFAVTISEAKARINMLQDFVKEMMIPNVDYGLIPGCNKPSLYKSGAEKLCDVYGFSKRIEIINRIENFDKGIFVYEIKATLVNKRTNAIEAEGIGSCNNKEKKYKNMDGFTICNTILKMAKKRALIDAVLSATRSSALFTQDIEDIHGDYTEVKSNTIIIKNKAEESNESNIIQSRYATTQEESAIDPIFKEQIHVMHSLVKQLGIPTEKMRTLIAEKYDVAKSSELNSVQANELIEFLIEMRNKRSRIENASM
jgi:hypothetical protein